MVVADYRTRTTAAEGQRLSRSQLDPLPPVPKLSSGPPQIPHLPTQHTPGNSMDRNPSLHRRVTITKSVVVSVMAQVYWIRNI